MQRIRERNIKLNPEKCTFKAKEVSYMDQLLTADGLKPDPEKVAAIRNMHDTGLCSILCSMYSPV